MENYIPLILRRVSLNTSLQPTEGWLQFNGLFFFAYIITTPNTHTPLQLMLQSIDAKLLSAAALMYSYINSLTQWNVTCRDCECEAPRGNHIHHYI